MLNIKNGKVKCVGYEKGERHFTVGKVYDVFDNKITSDGGYTYCHLSMDSKESIVDWLSGWYKFEAVTTDKIVIMHDGKTTTATLYRGDEKVVATAKCAPEDKFDFMVGAKLAMERLADGLINVGGFKVGDRVNYKGVNGTVICISTNDRLGVEFDVAHPELWCHNCDGVDLKAGKEGTKGTSKWLDPSDLKHGEAPKRYNGKVVCIKAGTDSWTVGKVYEVKDGCAVSDMGWRHPRFGEPYRDAEDIRHMGCDPLEDRRHNPDNEFVPLIEG